MTATLAPALRLAPRDDLAARAAAFAADGCVQAPNLLSPDDADRIERALREETDWRTVFNHGARHVDLHPMQLAALDPRGREVFAAGIAAGGASRFQYNYDNYPLYDIAADGAPLSSVHRALYDTLTGEAFLQFTRDLTGEPRIAFADCQATRYRAGHFLTTHDDDVDGKGRLFAYVLNLTRAWRADWGGLLLFYDAAGNVERGYTPAFNVLNIFRVPRPHAVSMVAPFAQSARYAITGWLRARP